MFEKILPGCFFYKNFYAHQNEYFNQFKQKFHFVAIKFSLILYKSLIFGHKTAMIRFLKLIINPFKKFRYEEIKNTKIGACKKDPLEGNFEDTVFVHRRTIKKRNLFKLVATLIS